MKRLKSSPLTSEAQIVGRPCAACNKAFAIGDVLTLVPLGPGDNPEARIAARAGRAYTGVAAMLHWACATGETDNDRIMVVSEYGNKA